MLKQLTVKNFLLFIKDVVKFRNLVLELAKKDFKNRYLGSYLGIIWGFIQPSISIIIMWFVFQVGFKAVPVSGFPFILWLITAMIPWLFFADSLNGATNSILENSYLVKKVVFRISVLPIVKILSSLFVHCFFVIFLFVIYSVYGYYPSINNIQFIYYTVALIFFVLGLSWTTASLIIFIKDIGQIVALIIQFGFWVTPVFWSFKLLPEQYHIFLKFNPIYYITEGYRGAFIYKEWFWEHPFLTIYFWSLTLIIWIIGAAVFKKLKPHFADVL
jgi:ABC-type polysaccharide/polyol phosphate export permease